PAFTVSEQKAVLTACTPQVRYTLTAHQGNLQPETFTPSYISGYALLKKSARMTCEIQTLETNFDGIIIHWYKQKEGEAPGRLLFVSGRKVTVESGFDANRYMAEGNSVQKQCILTIKDVIPDDAATYYCAYWDPHCDRNVFGTGTKLIVSEKKSSPPTNSEILKRKHENQTTYVCLIEKFYPEVIRVKWTDDEKEVTDNVVKGDTWQSTKEDKYSIASWLTVPAENEEKNYYCKYEHEEEKASLNYQKFSQEK
uniref:Ig-like domain-containing protein n=1 Tax=Catharus ustulatus TaxID=91951 RepID=A0A8C3TK82_CATUS